MHTSGRRKSILAVVAAAVVVAGLTLSGCHSEQMTAMSSGDQVCPLCDTQTRVMPITGLKYTTCVCPKCKKVSVLDAATREAVEAYTGGSVGDTVNVCEGCGAVIEACASCREASGM